MIHAAVIPTASGHHSTLVSPVLIERSATRYLLQGPKLWLEFNFMDDRWQHRIGMLSAADRSPVLSSVEGAAHDDAPPSPAFQDLRLESLSGSVHEFQLMGQSGPAVYSAAIRFDGESQLIDFDICARLRKSIAGFKTVSSYAVAEDWEAATADNDGAAIQRQGRSTTDRVLIIEPVEIRDSPQEHRHRAPIVVKETIVAGWDEQSIVPFGTGPLSLRWHYRMALISPVR